MLLSIAMIVKNEEKNIERCLKALRQLDGKLSYEIVVVDTGSNDATVDIVKKYTDRVYEHKWNNDFADMRNKSIRYCRGKWILVLDADEVLENPDEVVKFFDKDGESSKCNCAVIQFKNVLSANEDNVLLGSLIRLFKNKDEFCYQGRVHEQPKIISPIGYTNIALRHYGYSRESYELMEYKYERNLKLLLKDLEEGKDPIYTYFQLAQTYAMANKHNEGLDAIKNAYRIAKTKDISRYLYILHFYARDMLGRGNFEKVIELSEEALKYTDEHLDFYYLALRSYKSLNKFKKEEEYIKRYLKLYKKIKDGYIVKDISVNCFSFANYDDVLVYGVMNAYNQKKYEKIVEAFNEITKEADKEKLIEVFFYALMKMNRFDDIKKHFKKKKITDSDITNILNVLNRVCVEEVDRKSSEIAENMMGIDKKIDLYIENRYLSDQVSNLDEVNFDGFTEWKAEIAKDAYCKNETFIERLKCICGSDLKAYVISMTENFKCLENLCRYSKDNFLTTDLDELNILTNIEEVLLTSKSIEKDEYNELTQRALINKINYIKCIYNLAVINEKNAKSILCAHDYVVYDIFEAIKIYGDDKLKYIRKLKAALNISPEYSKMINFFLKKVDDTEISDDMRNEKQKLLNITEEYIGNNQIANAQEIINELMKIFKFDVDILSYNGVLNYIIQNYDESLINLGMADILLSGNFDTVYNIACVMEASGRKNNAVSYYEKAYNLCLDDNMKKGIIDVINALKEV